jgi:hypothetical protein
MPQQGRDHAVRDMTQGVENLRSTEAHCRRDDLAHHLADREREPHHEAEGEAHDELGGHGKRRVYLVPEYRRRDELGIGAVHDHRQHQRKAYARANRSHAPGQRRHRNHSRDARELERKPEQLRPQQGFERAHRITLAIEPSVREV